MKSGEGMAVIGASVRLRGELSGTEDLEFHGDVDGSISLTNARLTIGQQASVRGNISASEVIVLGRVDGNIVAGERADLRASAVVEGEISAARLSIEPGAQLKVKVDPGRSAEEAPAKAAGKESSVLPGLSSENKDKPGPTAGPTDKAAQTKA